MKNKELKKNFYLIYKYKLNYLLSSYTTYQCFKNFKLNKDILWVNGKYWGNSIYYTLGIIKELKESLSEKDDFKFVEKTLGNSIGVAIGLSFQKPVFVNITDSQCLIGLFWESLLMLKKFNAKVHILIDFNDFTRSNKNNLKVQELYDIIKVLGIKVNIKKPFEKLEIKEITEPEITIFHTRKYFKVPELEYLNSYNYKKINKDDFRNLLKYIDKDILEF